MLTSCEAIDIVVEVTGSIEPAANVVLDAFKHRKHVVLVNAELDSLLGPILKAKADEAGVVITHTDGDEPGVAMTLASLSAHPRTSRCCRRQHQGHGRLLSQPRHAARVSPRSTIRM